MLWEIIQAQTFSKNSKMIVISVCPIAKLFPGLTDQMENWSMGGLKRTIIYDFEELDGVWLIMID